MCTVFITSTLIFVFGILAFIILLIHRLLKGFLPLWRYATPFGLTSEYAHPAEILFLGFATIFGPAITGPHLITLWLWMVLRVLETVEAHCGYHFPWSLSNFLPLYGGWVWISFSFTRHQPLGLFCYCASC